MGFFVAGATLHALSPGFYMAGAALHALSLGFYMAGDTTSYLERDTTWYFILRPCLNFCNIYKKHVQNDKPVNIQLCQT